MLSGQSEGMTFFTDVEALSLLHEASLPVRPALGDHGCGRASTLPHPCARTPEGHEGGVTLAARDCPLCSHAWLSSPRPLMTTPNAACHPH